MDRTQELCSVNTIKYKIQSQKKGHFIFYPPWNEQKNQFYQRSYHADLY